MRTMLLLFLAACGASTPPRATEAPAEPASDETTPGQDEAPGIEIVCLEGTTAAPQAPETEALFAETMAYLEVWRASMTQPGEGCETSRVALSTRGHDIRTGCIEDAAFIEVFEHVGRMLAHPEATRACFDPLALGVESKAFRGAAPSVAAQEAARAMGVERPLLTELFAHEGALGAKLAQMEGDYDRAIARLGPRDHLPGDVSPKALPRLWAAAGWVAFYSDEEAAGSDDFRGSYMYTELMGPWGMIRVDTVDGEVFQGEIGLTYQGAGSFYLPHLHYPQEIYATLSEPACDRQFEVAFQPQSELTAGETFSPSGHWVDGSDPAIWAYYEGRETLHAFRASDCEGQATDNALISMWARAQVRDGTDQATHICVPQGATPATATPSDAFACAIRTADAD
jgi:hypothetical protein